jgi:tight adherence protein B
MTDSLVACATIGLFAWAQMIYWTHRAFVARRDSRLRGRMGVGQSLDLLRQRADAPRMLQLAEFIDQCGLDWTPTGTLLRGAALFAAGAMFGLAIGGVGNAFMFGLMGVIGLYLYLKRTRSRRIDLAGTQMPRALELLIMAMRAGYQLPRALAIAADETPIPISDELRRVQEEHELGRPIEEAFVGMGKRLDGCEPVRQLVTSLLVLSQTGGNLIELLERMIETMAQQTQYQQKMRSLSAEGRMSGWIVGLLPVLFVLAVMMADSNYISIFVRDPTGRLLGLLALGFWLAGVTWIRFLIRSVS